MAAFELLVFLATLAPQSGAAQQPAPAAQPVADSLWDRLRFQADGRLRWESTFDQLDGTDRHRGRLRLRASAFYEVLESLRAEARLSTSSDRTDANNPHWDFGGGADGFVGATIVLDRLNLEWQALDGLDLRAGKFAHAFTTPPVYPQYSWDEDVQPAGFAAVWNPVLEPLALDLRMVDYIVKENASEGDANMFGLQGNLGTDLHDGLGLRLSSSMQWWAGLDHLGSDFGNQGNTTTGGELDSDFTVWDSHLAADHAGGLLGRQQLFLQYVLNLDAASGQDAGLALGIELGQRAKAGDTSLWLSWYDFDANAFFSPVAQDDTPVAGTGTGAGMTGFLAGVRYVVSDRFSLHLWGLTSDVDEPERPWRIRLDLDFHVK